MLVKIVDYTVRPFNSIASIDFYRKKAEMFWVKARYFQTQKKIKGAFTGGKHPFSFVYRLLDRRNFLSASVFARESGKCALDEILMSILAVGDEKGLFLRCKTKMKKRGSTRIRRRARKKFHDRLFFANGNRGSIIFCLLPAFSGNDFALNFSFDGDSVLVQQTMETEIFPN